MIIITIDIGPVAVWAAMLIPLWFLGYFVYRLGAGVQEYRHRKGVEKCQAWIMRSPHIAMPAPQPPQRVDPRTANIIRRWGAEEEEEAA